jgi:hypothetical protein
MAGFLFRLETVVTVSPGLGRYRRRRCLPRSLRRDDSAWVIDGPAAEEVKIIAR